MLITNILKRARLDEGPSSRQILQTTVSWQDVLYIIGLANIKFPANLPQPHLFNAICILFEIVINMCTQLLT